VKEGREGRRGGPTWPRRGGSRPKPRQCLPRGVCDPRSSRSGGRGGRRKAKIEHEGGREGGKEEGREERCLPGSSTRRSRLVLTLLQREHLWLIGFAPR